MKSFLAKIGYLVLAILGLAVATLVIAAMDYPGVGVLFFLFGVPVSAYLIFKSKVGTSKKKDYPSPSSHIPGERTIKHDDEHDQESSSTEFRTHTTIKVQTTGYSIPKREPLEVRFLSANESMHVKGYQTGGLLYVAQSKTDQYADEPAVIYSNLNVKKSSLADPLGYWPDYSRMDPAQRNRYLEWLSTGRGDTDELGYAFLYFYGLERYVLRDAKNDKNREKNLLDITKEIVRLRKLFASNRSFDTYSNQLLDVIYVLFFTEKLDSRKTAFPNNNPVAAQYAIARAANSDGGHLLDSDWALHWLLGFGPVSRTKTVREHYSILRVLFRAVYEKETGGGIKVPTCKTKLKITFSPASMGLHDVSELDLPEWCDPTQLKRPMTTIHSIYEKVVPALRSLAKSVAKKDMTGILSSWPSGVPTDSLPKLDQVVNRVKEFCQKHQLSEMQIIAKLVGVNIDSKASVAQMNQIAAALETCGVVLVPDPLIHPIAVSASDPVVVYFGERLSEISPEAQSVSLSLQLGAMLCLSDGEVHDNEVRSLQKVVKSHPNSRERDYLEKYLTWRLEHPPTSSGLKKQIESLEDAAKNEIARLLVLLALADGELPSSEIKELEKLFVRLGLNKSLVTTYLHESTSDQIAPHQESSKSQSIKAFSLDEAALKQHAESTKEVQNVLAKIFEEDSEEPAKEEVVQTADVWHQGKLDEKHLALLEWMLNEEEWPMDKIQKKCQEIGLMADGALMKINDVAFETVGDSVLELGDPVEVYRDVLPV